MVAASTDITAEQRIRDAAKRLLEHGQATGPFMPWHDTKEPYLWIVAESLLRRTTRVAARRAFEALVESYPAWSELSSAPIEEIASKIACAGLTNQRSQQLQAMARTVAREFSSSALCDRVSLLSLHGVGDYIADVVLLNVCSEKVFPLDRNVQRIVKRVIGLPMAGNDRHADPYDDPCLVRVVRCMTLGYTASELAAMHRGILDIAWETCRSFRPSCSSCPLEDICGYSRLM